jgi:hypothetical protein
VSEPAGSPRASIIGAVREKIGPALVIYLNAVWGLAAKS